MGAKTFVWYELVTSDIDAALRFYGAVLGWTAQEFPGGEGRYVVVSAAAKGVGGVMALPDGMSHPFWMGYVGVEDADAAVAKLESAGATIHRRFDIPEVGRIALVTDRQGAGFSIIQGFSDRKSEAFDQALPGHGNWHELHTTAWEDAFDFYSSQFGWTKGNAVSMGAMGTYQLFEIDGAQAGAMFNDTNVPRPMWLYYFGTPDIDVAVDRVTAGGGKILFGPQEVPGGAFIINATDPQGAMFALVGPRLQGATG